MTDHKVQVPLSEHNICTAFIGHLNSLIMFMADSRKERKDVAVREAKERHQVSRNNSTGKVHKDCSLNTEKCGL